MNVIKKVMLSSLTVSTLLFVGLSSLVGSAMAETVATSSDSTATGYGTSSNGTATSASSNTTISSSNNGVPSVQPSNDEAIEITIP